MTSFKLKYLRLCQQEKTNHSLTHRQSTQACSYGSLPLTAIQFLETLSPDMAYHLEEEMFMMY